MNNIAMGTVLAVEKLWYEISPRADAIRALMNEFGASRATSSIGFLMLELGKTPLILYARARGYRASSRKVTGRG